MSAWTDRRKLAAKTLLMMALTLGMLAVLVGSYHPDWGNPLAVAIGLFGGFLLLVKIAEEALVLAFGWSVGKAVFDRRQLKALKFAPKKEE